MRSRSVSITGATGFLGGRLIAAFHAAGWQVRAIVRPGSEPRLPPQIEPRAAALHDVAALAGAFGGSDVVVHTAGVVRAGRRADFESVNVAGTHAVVLAANSARARLVHVSSLAAIGPGTPDRPAHEEDVPRPVNAYGRSKLAGEREVARHAQVPWIVLRPSAVYGPGDRGFFPLVQMARRGLFPMATRASMPFTFAYADDVAAAVVRAAESRVSGEAFFIGHAMPETAAAMLQAIAASLDRRYRPLPVPRSLVRLAGLAGDVAWRLGTKPMLDSSRVAEFAAEGFVCDVSKATAQLGFTAAVALADGIPETIRWYRRAGWIA